MSTEIHLTITEENATPENESAVASCTLESEDETASSQDNEVFPQFVDTAIDACCRAVEAERPSR